MNKKIGIILLFLAAFFKAMPQNFGSLPYTDSLAPAVDMVLADTVHNKLLVSSRLLNHAGGKRVRGICSWNGTAWDSLAGGVNTHDYSGNPNNPNGIVLGGIAYNGKFLVGGLFESIGGVNASNIATWDGTHWDSLPARAFRFLDYGGAVYSFIHYDNKLYLSGYFDSIQGQPANGLATFDGTTFHSVNVPLYNNAYIDNMIEYNGDLYIAGIFASSADHGDQDILKYDGTNWASVGGGIKGNSNFISSMVIYNNELYVGGYFYKSDGNAGNVVMKWDGSNWHEVAWGSDNDNGALRAMLLYHNKIYAFGSFDEAGDKKASNVAVFDGQKWCTYADSLDNGVESAAIYHDTIYISGAFKTINGDSSLRLIAKFNHPENINACGAVGIKTNKLETELIKIYPNPVADQLVITVNNSLKNLRLVITNPLGEAVYEQDHVNGRQEINTEHLNPGIYMLRCTTEQG
jgi:hypothetical protein